MKLSIKAENGGKFYDYTIDKSEWLKLADLAFEAELTSQREAKRETKKAGGCVSGFLHAYGVTTDHDVKSIEAGNPSAFPETDGDFEADYWLVAWNHSTGRGSSIEGRQAAWDKKFASIKADFMDLGASEEKATEKALQHAGKRPEAKAA